MAIIAIPNSTSTYSAEASVPNSGNRWAVLGFTANPAGSGSCFWFTGTAASAGSPLLPIVCASGHQTYQNPVVFNSPTGFFAGCIAGGCAFIWLKTACAA